MSFDDHLLHNNGKEYEGRYIQYEFDTYNFEKHFNHLAGVTEDEMKFLKILLKRVYE